jgi:site-specific DNA recombinase
MKKAVIYARVSSKDQEVEGFSIPAQLKELHAYAAKNGYRIMNEYTDVETAKKAGRTQFNKMVRLVIEDPSIKHILVEKTDRLTRNLPDYALIDDLMTRNDITVHLVKENSTLSKDSRSNEKFIFGIKALMAKNHSDNLSEEVKKGMLEKAAQGTYPSKAPYGYLNAKVDNKKVIVIDADAARFVKRAFELYDQDGQSLKKVRKTLLDEGMIYRNGKTFYVSTLETILKNKFYMGDFVWKEQRYEAASHEALVDKALFQRVQQRLSSPLKKSKSRKGLFPYSSLVSCGVCGCALSAEIKKEKYVYYRCTGYKGNCKQVYLKQEVLERQLEDALTNLAIDEALQILIMEGLRSSMEEKIAYHNKLVDQTQKQIRFLENRINDAYVDKLDKKITEEFWQANTIKWVADKERLSIKLLAIHRADTHYLENANAILELANKAIRLYKKQNAHEKRRLVDILVANCSYKDEKLDVELKPVFNEIAKTAKSGNWCAR